MTRLNVRLRQQLFASLMAQVRAVQAVHCTAVLAAHLTMPDAQSHVLFGF